MIKVSLIFCYVIILVFIFSSYVI